MGQNRREFLKRSALLGTGTLGALALSPLATPAETQPSGAAQNQTPAVASPNIATGIAHGLTLLNIKRDGQFRLAAKTQWGILDVAQASKALHMHAPSTMDEMLQNQNGASVNALIKAAANPKGGYKLFFREDRLEYGPVVTRPEKIICVGLNYRRHAAVAGQTLPAQPILFNKYNNALSGHYAQIHLPPDARKFDYGVSLVIVMGKEAKNVSAQEALSHVAGYSIGNDLSARDLQLEANGGQWMIGKTLDQFAPLGPYLVTADQVNPDTLMLECRVNGETRQSSSTRDLIFPTAQLISYISRYITLKPGDIIFTGTPEGVIQTRPKGKQVWLKRGDQVTCSVEKLGELQFQLV
jgi:2-keto-4-pentenoate hydratase/2-oxohepta-3-ene-1,7-dioic acid hydratase in catechol pathway